ncbi:hypothetical protein SDC9_01428 [bioreactor metagenome]|jgi:hypothetical protein|uniref:Secretion system C-terminal sorting domain-containing protein n=1 Tax=bioreactor metagenome TaxID=1076179 RepID=A0A644SMX8_9ZZZZ
MQKFTFLFKTTFFFLFAFTLNAYSQSTYDFSSGLTIYKSSGSSNFDEAKFTVGGVEYKIQGGINGNLTNPSTGGVSNTKCLKKDTAGGDTFTLSRTDGQPFQFYGLWVKHNSMNSYAAFYSLPPFFTMNASNGCTSVASYTDATAIQGGSYTTSSYTWSIPNDGFTVTSVQISYKATLEWWIDNIIVGTALNNSPTNISTANPTVITSNSAVLGGNLTESDTYYGEWGIVWSNVNSTPIFDYGTTPDNYSVSSTTTGNFSSTVNFDGIPVGSTIYYRAYADNWDCGMVEYGDVKSFVLTGSLKSIDVNKTNDFIVYPNPVHSFVKISGLQQKSNVQILDTNGKLILQRKIDNNEDLNVEFLPPGIYFIKVKDEVTKFIKK